MLCVQARHCGSGHARCRTRRLSLPLLSVPGRRRSARGKNLQHVWAAHAHERRPGGQQLHPAGAPGRAAHGMSASGGQERLAATSKCSRDLDLGNRIPEVAAWCVCIRAACSDGDSKRTRRARNRKSARRRVTARSEPTDTRCGGPRAWCTLPGLRVCPSAQACVQSSFPTSPWPTGSSPGCVCTQCPSGGPEVDVFEAVWAVFLAVLRSSPSASRPHPGGGGFWSTVATWWPGISGLRVQRG